MGKAEELHELIHTNLCLLKAEGYHIDFKQGMFREHNLPGFEAVGYALLMIIDPTECKSKIPWPLVNDKAQTREFRTNFTKFIKMINSRYQDAHIPEITASTLQFPGGLNFLYFMYKLSTFALELELKKTLGSEERENLLPKPILSKQVKDQKVKLMVVKGALVREQNLLRKIKEECKEDGPMILKQMNDCFNNITKHYKSVSEQLKLKVASLDCDDKTKEGLLDIEDTNTITVYNERIEKKLEELESNSRKLSNLHNLAAQCCQHGETPGTLENILDGHKLGLNRCLNELVGGPIVNVDGDVKLTEVVRAAHLTVTRLTRTSSASNLLSPFQDLQTRCRAIAARVFKAESALRHLSLENNKAVTNLRPFVYSGMKRTKVPDAFQYLQERPPLNLIRPQSTAVKELAVKQGRRRRSFGSILNRRNKVVCSFKTRREPKKHISSTPFFKTPACRKSLYNTLPSGKRPKRIEEDKPQELTPDNPMPLTPQPSIQESTISEPSTFNSYSTNEAGSPQLPTPPLRKGRKSLNDIVERFLRLKRSMNLSSNSRNESDTCNESET